MIHAPRKCPIAVCPKVKEHLDKMECLGVITCVDEPMDWVSSITMFRRQMVSYASAWILMTSTGPSAKIITRWPLCRKSLMSSCTLATSPSWMPAMDTGQSSSTRTQACLQHSTVLLEDTVSCDFPLASSAPKTSSRRRWTRP